MLEHRTLANGFTERGGKPWEKGWIESAFNLMHNRAGNQPGQTGSLEQQNAPGDLAAKIAYAEGILKDVTPEQADKFKLPFNSVSEATLAYGAIFDWMDQRGEHVPHAMIGFERIKEWTAGPGQPWRSMDQLALVPAEQHCAMEIRDRVQSPRERWRALCARCVRVEVPEFAIALLAYTPKAKLILKDHKITFKAGEFKGTFLDTDGQLAHLQEGTELIGYYDKENPNQLFVTDQQGSAVAVLKAQGIAGIKDAAAISAAQAEIARWMHNQVQHPVRMLLGDEESRLAAAAAHNDAARAELGLKAISSDVRPGTSRALPGDNSKNESSAPVQTADAKPERRRLTSTLARDQFAPAPAQFAPALQAASTIAAAATEQTNCKTRAEALQQADDLDSSTLI